MINENIKKARENAGISQRELARRIGKTGQYISYLEKNNSANPSIDVLKDIAKALNVDVNILLGGSDDFSASFIVDHMLNSTLFDDIDFTKTNYVGSLIDHKNIYSALSKLLLDVIKIIIYVEDIEPRSIKKTVLDETRGLIIELLTRKDKIYKLEGNHWDAFKNKFPHFHLVIEANENGIESLSTSDRNKLKKYYSDFPKDQIPKSLESLFNE